MIRTVTRKMSEEIKAAAVTTVVPLEEKTPAVLYDDEIATVEGLEGAERTAAKEAWVAQIDLEKSS